MTDIFVGQKFRVVVGTEYDKCVDDNAIPFAGKIVTLKEVSGGQSGFEKLYKCSFDEGQGLDEELMNGVQWSFYKSELESV